jgi:nicotinate phosphoribosyltransferase
MGSLLATDGYKFSMAEAGYPLRRETFYYTHRRGGPQLWVLDAERIVKALLPTPTADDYAFLERAQYEMGGGFKAAMTAASEVVVHALPSGTWFLPGEPVFSVTGPSALVSWLEPQLLMLHYRVQVATLALTDRAKLTAAVRSVTCQEERELVEATLGTLDEPPPALTVESDAYRNGVRERAAALVAEVEDASRIFEVGLRAASTFAQHRLALEGCRDAGVGRTSNVLGAKELGLVAVGTMGHEHVQRFGSDEAAYRAMKERRPQRSSFLLDTFDTLRSGLPTALRIIAEDPKAKDSIRYDSGDKDAQLRAACALAKELGVRPVHILEDGFDLPQTKHFEGVRKELGLPKDEVFYGFGGHLVAQGPLTRDRVAAVYKLSKTGARPVMKFSNDAGKKSIPGEPVVWRRVSGDGPGGIVAQRDEPVRAGYMLLTDASPRFDRPDDERVEPSDGTRALMAVCENEAFSFLKGS